jgi:hypothetical protein
MAAKSIDRRCKGRAKSGKPCQAAATDGGLCFFHANPDKASELGRIGGRSNRHAASANADPPPALDTAMAVRDTVARLIADVYAGRINPRTAAGLAPLLNLQMRAIETTDLEQRLAKLEKLSKEATVEAESNLNGKRPGEEVVKSAREKLIKALSSKDELEQMANELEKA